MNANELADIQAFKTEELTIWERNTTAIMLRQQQAEIETLKAEKIRAYNNGVEDGRKPDTNNKPVAWMNPNESSIDYKFSDECAGDWNIPLYTHPVKLTDEEITELANEYLCYISHEYEVTGIYKFARAILRKAQEQ